MRTDGLKPKSGQICHTERNGVETPALKQIPIKLIITHRACHWDEIVAITLLQQYGEKLFPGISRAQIRFVENPQDTQESLDAMGVLPIGCCFTRFDEHVNGASGRIEGECAATLVAKYLGLYERPEFERLLEETYQCDSDKGVGRTEIAELIKVGHRCLRRTPEQVLETGKRVVIALLWQEKMHFSAVACEKTILQIFEELVKEGHFSEHGSVQNSMRKLLTRSMQNKERLTELASVVEALYRYQQPCNEEEVMRIVDFYLATMEADEIAFREEVNRLKNARLKFRIPAVLNGKETRLNLLVCKDPNPYTQKAARYLEADLIVCREETRNTQIFANTRVEGLNLSNIVRMIRALELGNSKTPIQWSRLGEAGHYTGVEWWYYFKKGEQLFNGNITHSAPPTSICLQEIINVLECAFHPKHFKRWCEEHGINPRREEVNGN